MDPVIAKQNLHRIGCGLIESHEGPCGPAPPVLPASRRDDRIAFLERKRVATKADLLMKFEDEDFHGVADAAMDLRDIDSELKGLRL